MAGSIVVTATDVGRGVTKYSLAWTCDASGVVSVTTTPIKTGRIEQIRTVPSGGGTAPTTLYDITLLDSDSADILNGCGADRSATVVEVRRPGDGASPALIGAFIEGGNFTLTIANAGNAKQGTFVLYVA